MTTYTSVDSCCYIVTMYVAIVPGYPAWHGAKHLHYLCILQLIVGQIYTAVMESYQSIQTAIWPYDPVAVQDIGYCTSGLFGRGFPHNPILWWFLTLLKSICQHLFMAQWVDYCEGNLLTSVASVYIFSIHKAYLFLGPYVHIYILKYICMRVCTTKFICTQTWFACKQNFNM